LVEINDIARFPFSLTQKPGYCIPANVEAVTRYLRPDPPPANQDYIAQRYENQGGTMPTISLSSIRNLVLNTDPEFRWVKSEFIPPESLSNFQALVGRIEASINSSIPHILSVPIFVGNRLANWHMLTVVGYDDRNFQLYNSEPTQTLPGRFAIETNVLRSSLLSAHPTSDVTDSLVIRRST